MTPRYVYCDPSWGSQQIYVVSRGTDELAHLHLSSAETSPSSTDLWWHPTVEAPFTVGATDEVVVVGAEESDEVRLPHGEAFISLLPGC